MLKYKENLCKVLGSIGLAIYLLGSCLVSMFYMYESSEYPFLFKDVSTILSFMGIASVLTCICIFISKKRYIVGLVFMILFSIVPTGMLNSSSDIRKAGIIYLVLNMIIIAFIIYNNIILKNKSKKLNSK